MKFFALPAGGRTCLMAGDSIREAMQKLEQRAHVVIDMGGEVKGNDLRRCDPSHLNASEYAACVEAIEEAQQ